MVETALVDTLNKKWKDDKSGFGFKLLQKMGWKENSGLGKDEIGQVEVIRVKKRDDGLGLGCESIGNRANNNWGSTASSYASVLEALKATYASTEVEKVVDKKKKKSSKSDSKKERKEKRKSSEPVPMIEVGMK